MRTVVGRKGKCLAGRDTGESFGVDDQAGKALRKCSWAAKPEKRKAARKGAAGYVISVHRQRF